MSNLDTKNETDLEAATFRRLLEHLRARTDVQNIDLMNLAGFCRNCLSNWYQEAAAVLRAHLVSWPNNQSGRLELVVAYIELNLPEEARAQAAEVMRISPHFSIEGQKKINALKDQSVTEHWAADWRKAGLK